MPQPPPESSEPLVPTLALAVYIACVGGTAAVTNCTLVGALLKAARNGVYSIVIQLAIADLFLIGASLTPELWSTNVKNWPFGYGACSAFRGFRVLASTASSYLIVAIALHTLATINMEEKAAIKRNKKNFQDEDDEIRTSRHSLVAKSDSSTPPRTMNVDYRLSDTHVPVAPPTIFVWVLAVSLSIPEFVLSTVIHVDRDHFQCTSVDTNHLINMHTLLAVFELILPIVIMSVTCTLIIIKLRNKKLFFEIWNRDSIAALKLSLWIIVTYGVLCVPRSVTSVYHVYSLSNNGNEREISPIDWIPKTYETAVISLISSGAAYLATTVRPILCFLFLPRPKIILCARNFEKNFRNV